jgi:hypothetical protein
LLALSDTPAPIKAQNATTSISGASRIAMRRYNYNHLAFLKRKYR